MKISRFVFALMAAASVSDLLLGQSTPLAEGKTLERPQEVQVKSAPRYESGGRLDPFVDMDVVRAEEVKPEEQFAEPIPSAVERQAQFPSIRGMLISELRLQGVIKTKDDLRGFFAGSDGRAHFLRKSDLLYNAKVQDIVRKKDSETGKVSYFVVFIEYKPKAKLNLTQPVESDRVLRSMPITVSEAVERMRDDLRKTLSSDAQVEAVLRKSVDVAPVTVDLHD